MIEVLEKGRISRAAESTRLAARETVKALRTGSKFKERNQVESSANQRTHAKEAEKHKRGVVAGEAASNGPSLRPLLASLTSTFSSWRSRTGDDGQGFDLSGEATNCRVLPRAGAGA